MLNISPGLAPGDLTIDPNGSYVWNTTTAMSGHWIKGKSSPVALVDSNQHKNWNVRIVDGHIEINDGQSLTRYVGQR